jgi:nucleotide-binding universal stress UspA family protein
MMKRILVPVDFSTSAQNAAEVAILLAKRMEGTLFFLHFTPTDEWHVSGTAVDQSLPVKNKRAGKATTSLAELVDRSSKEGVDAIPILVFDRGNEKVENYTTPYRIDCIVMGAHKVSGIREFIFGSNAQQILRHTHIPLLVIKNEISGLPFRHILFASTFTHLSLDALEQLVLLARHFDSTLHLVYLNLSHHRVKQEEAREFMDMLTRPFSGAPMTIDVLETDDEEGAIGQLTERWNADLIAVHADEEDNPFQLFDHSVAEALVKHVDAPVLVLRSRRDRMLAAADQRQVELTDTR